MRVSWDGSGRGLGRALCLGVLRKIEVQRLVGESVCKSTKLKNEAGGRALLFTERDFFFCYFWARLCLHAVGLPCVPPDVINQTPEGSARARCHKQMLVSSSLVEENISCA